MIKRLIEYLTIERRTEYIQYKSSLKSSNARDYINYSTLKTISIKISTVFVNLFIQLILKLISIFILHVQFSTSIFSKIFFIFINNCFTFDFLTFLFNLH